MPFRNGTDRRVCSWIPDHHDCGSAPEPIGRIRQMADQDFWNGLVARAKSVGRNTAGLPEIEVGKDREHIVEIDFFGTPATSAKQCDRI